MTGYISTIPNGTDNLSTSQGQMKTNFGVLQTLYAQDHGGWTDATANGLHKKVTFYQVAAPGAQVDPSSIAYTKLVSTHPELFFRNSTSTGVQITSGASPIWKGGTYDLTGAVALTDTANGSVIFPNGLTINWGTASKKTDQTVSFTTAYTSASNVYSIQCTVFQNSDSRQFVQVKTVSASSFTVACRDSGGADDTIKFYWMAIGT